MEVHKHPHHVTHKKKWYEYLLEFFMLFLAVFLGFTAENIREGRVEKHREKEYIHSLLQDLRQDSSKFKKITQDNEADLKNIDTSINLLNAPVITDSIAKILYYSHKVNPYFRTLIFNQRTIAQLKSAGGFRLITNQDLSDKIVIYNDAVEFAAWLRQELLSALKDDRSSAYLIFNDFLIKNYSPVNMIDMLHSAGKYLLLTTDKTILIPYANKLKMRYDWLFSYNQSLKNLQGMCKELMELIKKDYHLENE